ncbi:SDR family NAD(P)-dependent oxidoreductase [Sphingosinithalassobacter portus]|uniref:SDR family NAD(P)-dependent oxidoreductase n=1 Tax=Stakelama portus TaxID=2676234 RepID=UPI000D6E4589|nr:SDR family oxidoreductase [Sphingosinithalassobacter portus]
MGSLSGKVAVVTGAGRAGGLGAAILTRFAQEGADCVLSDREIGDEAMATIAALERKGVRARAIACDVSDPVAAAALIEQAEAELGRSDILVNNAGIGFMMKPLLDVDPADWDMVLKVNLSGAFYMTQAAGRAMKRRGEGGRIINIASQAAKTAVPHLAGYVASKHGMIGLTRAAALELGPLGITVNAVCPNHVTTPLGAQQNAYYSRLLGFESVEAYLANMSAKNPMGRPGLGSDTAAACAFLASEDAFYINGEALNVSGGEEMH